MNTFSSFLNFLFPLNCIFCKQEGARVCKSCFTKQFKAQTQQICPLSLKNSPQGKVIKTQEGFYLDALLSTAQYNQNKFLQKLFHQFKYFFAVDIAEILSNEMKKLLEKEKININDFTITYVPLHWKRFLDRGFNQSYLLASGIQKPKQLLKRVRHTPQQAHLHREERLKNLNNAFQFIGKNIPKKVLLVDDIASTSTTLNECARSLKEAGVEEVFAIVIARNT